MARCRCLAESCTCHVTQGLNVSITGTGAEDDPWVINAGAAANGTVVFNDTDEVAFTVTGGGIPTDPYLIAAESPWVEAAAGMIGEVLTKQADGVWRGQNVSTMPGLINTAEGLVGDGSVAAPLRVRLCTYQDLQTLCAP